MNTAASSSNSVCPLQAPGLPARSKLFIPPSKATPDAITDAVGRLVEPTEEGQSVTTAVWGQETPPLICQVTDTGLEVVVDLVVVDLRVVVDLVVVDLVVESLVVVLRVVVCAVARARRRVLARRENFIVVLIGGGLSAGFSVVL